MKWHHTLMAHYRLWCDYYHTPKGGHDIRDYLRAFCIIVLTIAVVMGMVMFLTD